MSLSVSKQAVVYRLYEIAMYVYNGVFAWVPWAFLRLLYLRLLGARIGRGSVVNMRQYIMWPCFLKIGDHVHINEGCFLDCRGGITIGSNVSISHRVSIVTATHDAHSSDFAYKRGSVEIGNDVWVGINATILGPLKIGQGAVIAAGAVCTKDVLPYTIVAGVPARQIGTRTNDLRYTVTYGSICC